MIEDDERYDVCFGKRGRDWNRAAGRGAVVGLYDDAQSCVRLVIHMGLPWKGKELMHVLCRGWILEHLGVRCLFWASSLHLWERRGSSAGQGLSNPSREQEPVLTSFNEEFHGLLLSPDTLGLPEPPGF